MLRPVQFVSILIILFTAFLMLQSFYVKKESGVLANVKVVENVLKEENSFEKKSEIENKSDIEKEEDLIPTFKNIDSIKTVFKNDEGFINHFYNYDKKTVLAYKNVNIDEFLKKDFKTDLKTKEPKILIFHTHSKEAYIDSQEGVVEDTVVGVGQKLAEILVSDYKYSVVHDTGIYDDEKKKDSYKHMEPAIKSILKKYPSIEIAIDIHRDGVPEDKKFAMDIEGKQTAQIMFFNGTYENENNPYLEENLALSLHMQLAANEMFPGFCRKLYMKHKGYSQHFLPKSLLVEVGANTNTVEEAKNAMYPLAQVISAVFEENE